MDRPGYFYLGKSVNPDEERRKINMRPTKTTKLFTKHSKSSTLRSGRIQEHTHASRRLWPQHQNEGDPTLLKQQCIPLNLSATLATAKSSAEIMASG